MIKRFVFFISISLAIVACRDSNNSEFHDLNEWVYSNLYDYYFWYKEIDNHRVPGSLYPEDYFYSLLYDAEDKWSYITNDYNSLSGELEGEPISMGYSPAFGRISETDDVFMLIEYVYPNSPAFKAGLRRGDLITKINGEQLNTSNYTDLYRVKSQVVSLAEIVEGTVKNTDVSYSMEAELIQVNPVLFDTVYAYDGLKIGYCVITEFLNPDTFKEKVGVVLSNFKNLGINELIVDLRYNRGGYMSSAQWLASAIAPTNLVSNSEVLTEMVYNDKLEKVIPEDERISYFIENDVNLNMNKVYFLVTGSSASASELTIIGLEPYMNVELIGENTYGKYTGSIVIPDENDPPKHNWAMMPIVLKYSNAEGFTNFTNGLDPDYYVEEDLFAAVPFGDVTDPLLNKALLLCGSTVKSSNLKRASVGFSYNFLSTQKQLIRSNLIIDK